MRRSVPLQRGRSRSRSGRRRRLSIHSTLLSSETGIGAEPPISSANRASLRRFSFVSRINKSMSCVVTGAPFSMLAQFPMTTASSLAVRSARASATSVLSETSEDIPAVIPARDERRPTSGGEKQGTDDQTQVARIDLRKLRTEARAHVLDLAGKQFRISRPAPACPVHPGRGTLRGGPALAAKPPHLARIHRSHHNPSAWVRHRRPRRTDRP